MYSSREKGYYDLLEPRARALVNNPDSSVWDFALETLKEIEVFRISDDSYGYVFYVQKRIQRKEKNNVFSAFPTAPDTISW
jgi:hypothetical protein